MLPVTPVGTVMVLVAASRVNSAAEAEAPRVYLVPRVESSFKA